MDYLRVLLRRISSDILVLFAFLVMITIVLKLFKVPVTFASFMLSFALSLLLRWLMIRVQRAVNNRKSAGRQAPSGDQKSIEGGPGSDPDGDASRGSRNRWH